MNIQMYSGANNYAGAIRLRRDIDAGSSDSTFAHGNSSGSRPRGMAWVSNNASGYESVISWCVIDKTHNTTNALTYKVQLIAHGNHTIHFNFHHNVGDGNSGYHSTGYSNIIAQELGHTVTDA